MAPSSAVRTKTRAFGVAKPKKSAAVMPAKGGTQLTPQQIEAVAAYIGSLRRRE